MLTFNLLDEADFTSAMRTDNKTWRDTCVSQGHFKSLDGAALNYYCAVPENAKAAVVFLHGFCEFWGKYHEYAWYLYQAGFSIYFLEQRGHGYSEGKLSEPDIVFIDDYNTYVEDFRCFMEKIVIPHTENQKKLLLAHSMGGAVGSLFLEKYPDYFSAAILSSPMLKMKNNTSPVVIKALSIYSFLFNKRKNLAPGQRRFDAQPVFETSSALSKARYDYMFEMRIEDKHYQTYGASIGWALASLKTNKRIMKNAYKINIPVAVFTAGDDHLIDMDGYKEFEQKVPQAKFFTFEKSRHEIFNADDKTRKDYFSSVIETLEGFILR